MVNPRRSEKTREEEVLVPLRETLLHARQYGRSAWLGGGLFVAFAPQRIGQVERKDGD